MRCGMPGHQAVGYEARAAVEMLFPGRRPYDPKKPDPIDDSDDDYDDD